MDGRTWEVSLNVPLITATEPRLDEPAQLGPEPGVHHQARTFRSTSTRTVVFAVGERYGNVYGNKFVTNCSQLPGRLPGALRRRQGVAGERRGLHRLGRCRQLVQGRPDQESVAVDDRRLRRERRGLRRHPGHQELPRGRRQGQHAVGPAAGALGHADGGARFERLRDQPAARQRPCRSGRWAGRTTCSTSASTVCAARQDVRQQDLQRQTATGRGATS